LTRPFAGANVLASLLLKEMIFVKQIRERLSYANVMSSLAVFLVLGGGTAFALARNSIGTRELQRNAVTRGILARNSVYPGKINPEAVKAGRIAKNAIAQDRLRNGIVSTDKLQDLAVTGTKLGDDAVTNPKIVDDAVNQQKLASSSVGAPQLKGFTTRTNSVAVNAGTSNATSVSCQDGEQIISAGIHWNAFEVNLETNYIRIVGNAAVGRGNNDTGTNRTLFVDAYCLSN
jgi:hypothetical protein